MDVPRRRSHPRRCQLVRVTLRTPRKGRRTSRSLSTPLLGLRCSTIIRITIETASTGLEAVVIVAPTVSLWCSRGMQCLCRNRPHRACCSRAQVGGRTGFQEGDLRAVRGQDCARQGRQPARRTCLVGYPHMDRLVLPILLSRPGRMHAPHSPVPRCMGAPRAAGRPTLQRRAPCRCNMAPHSLIESLPFAGSTSTRPPRARAMRSSPRRCGAWTLRCAAAVSRSEFTARLRRTMSRGS